jgi:hypothetical protein
LKFIDGTADFYAVPCEKCPAMIIPEENRCDRHCRANFLTWLINEEDE